MGGKGDSDGLGDSCVVRTGQAQEFDPNHLDLEHPGLVVCDDGLGDVVPAQIPPEKWDIPCTGAQDGPLFR